MDKNLLSAEKFEEFKQKIISIQGLILDKFLGIVNIEGACHYSGLLDFITEYWENIE